jgi:aminomuconate-semialdehyde/2-hydroxymuconate-6-semialdehyde dehydrogenase
VFKIKNYINGELVGPLSGKYFDNFNPADGMVYSHIPDSDTADVELAASAAKAAFPGWAATSVEERHDLLTRIAKLIEQKLETLALAESVDNGKPVSLAKSVDIPRASKNFEFFANAITQFASQSHETNQAAINYTLRRPLGVVCCISPWNLPLYLFTWKIAPALAAGNTVVAKPSEITPMTAYLLSEICIEAGLPKGVLNIVHGYGHTAGNAMVSHPLVKAISFTGGTQTGAKIALVAAPMFKKLSLELGGKNPNIIFADCEYDQALETTLRSSFSNQGQICLCGSRIYIERPIYERFKNDLVKAVKSMKVGHPAKEDTRIGALVSKPHLEKVESYVKLAEEEGGKILCGGKRVNVEGFEGGYYFKPAVIEGLANTCRTNQEEIFGPVVTLMPFDTDDEVLGYANNVRYGLSCTLWTQNLTRAMRFATELEAGVVWVNTWLFRDLRTPFGGMKDSGVGREGGFEALQFFTEAKNVCIKY